MGQAYFITGTGYGIGKTTATSLLYLSLTALGKKVAIFKPIKTGLEDGEDKEKQFGPKKTRMYELKPKAAPHLAFKLTGQHADEKRIIKHIQRLKREYDIVLVEGTGGVAVPLIERDGHFYMTSDLIKDCGLPVIFVTPSKFGFISHVLTTHLYIAMQNIETKALLFNLFEEDSVIHRDNVNTITKLTGLEPLLCIPAFKQIKEDLILFSERLMQDEQYVQHLKSIFFHEYSIK